MCSRYIIMDRSDGHFIHANAERGLPVFFIFHVHTMYDIQIFQLHYWYEFLHIVEIHQNIVL